MWSIIPFRSVYMWCIFEMSRTGHSHDSRPGAIIYLGLSLLWNNLFGKIDFLQHNLRNFSCDTVMQNLSSVTMLFQFSVERSYLITDITKLKHCIAVWRTLWVTGACWSLVYAAPMTIDGSRPTFPTLYLPDNHRNLKQFTLPTEVLWSQEQPKAKLFK